MEAYSLGRDSSQCMIERLDAERRKLAIGRHVHLRMNLPGIGKVRVVNLKNQTALGNGSVFFMHRVGNSREVGVVVGVVFILEPVLDGAGCDGRKECLLDFGALERGPQIRDVSLHCGLADILDRSGTGGLSYSKGASSGKVLREFRFVSTINLEQRAPRISRPLLYSTQTLAGIGGKIDLRQLAVVDDIDPRFNLLTYNFCHGAAHTPGKLLLVIGLATISRESASAGGRLDVADFRR